MISKGLLSAAFKQGALKQGSPYAEMVARRRTPGWDEDSGDATAYRADAR